MSKTAYLRYFSRCIEGEVPCVHIARYKHHAYVIFDLSPLPGERRFAETEEMGQALRRMVARFGAKGEVGGMSTQLRVCNEQAEPLAAALLRLWKQGQSGHRSRRRSDSRRTGREPSRLPGWILHPPDCGDAARSPFCASTHCGSMRWRNRLGDSASQLSSRALLPGHRITQTGECEERLLMNPSPKG